MAVSGNPNHPIRTPTPKIWWSNAIFFLTVHVAACLGIYFYPPSRVSKYTLWLCFITWQLADFGITIGYHRLWSHRAFRASLGVRIVLAALGSAGFQGSIKWWCLRHRLHHRFTDDPIHDPYAATRGLVYSHMGWIFFKPEYSRMELVDREDLNRDSVVRFQHRHYIPLALSFGFLLPTILGFSWGDPVGAYIWGGLVSRLLIWHATFCVNSLAHWEGLQPYSDEDTSRGNLILALITGGEGSHNFHAFPYDFRSGPSKLNWDPSKWIIALLNRAGLVTNLRTARQSEIHDARTFMHHKNHHGEPHSNAEEPWEGEIWDIKHSLRYMKERPGSCLVLIDGYIVDVTRYMRDHPGGAIILRKYSLKEACDDRSSPDATWGFFGGLNNHGRASRRKMRELRIAKYRE